MEELRVLEIRGADAYIVRPDIMDRNRQYLINGVMLNDSVKGIGFVFSSEDKVEFLSRYKVLVDYRRGDDILSVEEYKAQPQWYGDNSSDEEVLRVIANKKELEGFEPHEVDPTPEQVKLAVKGFVEDTGSIFIGCSVSTSQYSSSPVVYTTYGNRIAMDEYLKCKEEYANHAQFFDGDRDYLRFNKINGNYSFGQGKPFGDYHYRETFLTLSEAQQEESMVRNAVRSVVKRAVFPSKGLTENRAVQTISTLRLIKKLKTRKSVDEALSVLIQDLDDYARQGK